MADIAGKSVLHAFYTLVAIMILIPASCSLGAVPGRGPCKVPPPALKNGEYVGSEEDRLAFYNCHEQFWLKEPSRLKCVTSADGNDSWVPYEGTEDDSQERPECRPFQDCKEPQITRGGFDGDCCAPGDQIEFYCDDAERYTLSGAANATCLPNGSWSETLPVCRDTYCKDPGRSPNGHRTIVFKRRIYMGECCPPNAAVYHVCDEGYQLVGEQTIRCGAYGTWNHARPKCKPEGACDDFEVAHGRLTGERSGGDFFAPGDSAFVECDHGFRVNGTDQLFCEDDGMWDELVPTCVEYNCTRFDPGPHLIVEEFEMNNATTFPEGSSINYRCEHGYLLQGVFSTTCRDGGWFGRIPKCEQITCGHLRTPQHGWMTGANSTAVGSKARFGCFQGYELMGSRERECQDYGEWSGSPVRCVPLAMYTDKRRTSCLDPGTPDNGGREGRSRFLIGSEVEFTCNPGYHLSGNATIRCLASGKWSAKLPLCLGKYYFDDKRNVEEALGGKLSEDIQLPVSQQNNSDGVRGRALNLDSPNIKHYVYFLFDSSTSIGKRNFRYGINLAKAITRKVTVSEDGNRIGAIVFAREAEEVIQLTECKSTEDALQKLDNIEYTGGSGTSIKAGINRLKTSLDTVRANLGARSYKSVNFSIFLITDGKANIGGSVDRMALKGKRVEVYCIGITGSTQRDTLEKLASTPTSTHLFILRNYDAMQWLAETLTNGTIDYGVCGISNKHRRDTGRDDDEPRPRILGGERVVHSWPWMVQITLIDSPDWVTCGGTIIAKKWILTAAHCMYYAKKSRYLEPADIRVRARLISTKGNAKDFEDPNQPSPVPTELNTPKELLVDAIVLHENYSSPSSQFSNDIALLRLKDEITYEKFIRPICLPPAKDNIPAISTFYKEGESAIVIGWGVEKNKQTYSAERLKQLVKKIGSESDCRGSQLKGNYTSQGMMCAKSDSGDSCQGDSGGPLMQGVEDEETVWTQVGIVSWGGSCRAKKFAFYTDVAYYVPWIQRHLDADAAAEAAGPANAANNAVVDHAVQP